MVKFIAIASVLFLLSCHSDLPSLSEFPKAESCNYAVNGVAVCKSISNNEISKAECDFFDGDVFEGNCE
jgi:hypothetical protein